MKLHLENLIELGLEGLSSEKLRQEGSKIEAFLAAFDARDQGFARLPKAKAALLAVKHMADKFMGKHENIVVLGIGGSALGISCIRDSLFGPHYNMSGKGPRLFVLDNLDHIQEVEPLIDVDKTLFIVISKSGRTPETMAQYFYFREKAKRDQFVFITDPSLGELNAIAQSEGIPTLGIPENVGGRFSVLTPVGLFPAALLGVDIEAMLEGAGEMADEFYKKEFDLNRPFQLAAAQYLLEWKHGVNMTVMMPYATRLKTFADWYAQLLAESTGKDGKGLTPIGALGVTDQHSQLQLYNEGPMDKFIGLIHVESLPGPQIPKIKHPPLVYLSELPFTALMHTEMRGVQKALLEYGKPSFTLEIPEISAKTLGQLFMLFEASIAFLGEYYKINAFNQPGVELSKRLTKELLSKPSL